MRARGLWLALASRFWWWLRQVTGDAAYENYLRHVSRPCANSCCTKGSLEDIITAEQFYLDRLHRKYARVSRCC
jgi:hypothetical protein